MPKELNQNTNNLIKPSENMPANMHTIMAEIIAQLSTDTKEQKPIEDVLYISDSPASLNNLANCKESIQSFDVVSNSKVHSLAFTKRYDLAVWLLYEKNTLNFAQGITKLRDLLAKQVLIVTHKDDDLLSFGFSKLSENATHIFWQFNIFAYKDVPDWLNAKFWANPENWGKYRW